MKWELLPKPFIVVVTFCITFAMTSLLGLLFFGGPTASVTSSSSTSSSSSAGEVSSKNLLLVGVMTSIMGSLTTASGYCCQRLGHQIQSLNMASSELEAGTEQGEDQSRTENQTSAVSNPLIAIGILLLGCGTVSAVMNLGILGMSVTAPFAALTLIFNGILACTVLHEKVTKSDLVSTFVVLIGVTLAVIGVQMADLPVQHYALADIEELLQRSWLPALYSLVVLGSLLACYAYVVCRDLAQDPLGLACFSIGAGTLSGFSSMCVKCTVELIKYAVKNPDENDLGNPLTYTFVVGIPICVLSQLHLMSLGLKNFGTLKYVPTYQAFIIMSNLVNGMVFFDEAKTYSAISMGLFVGGCSVTIFGVLMLLAKVAPARSTTAQDLDMHELKMTAVKKGQSSSSSSSVGGIVFTPEPTCLVPPVLLIKSGDQVVPLDSGILHLESDDQATLDSPNSRFPANSW